MQLLDAALYLAGVKSKFRKQKINSLFLYNTTMRHLLLSLLALLLFTVSCKKNKESVPVLNGTYVGTFERTPLIVRQISNVTIEFSEGKWNGKSEIEKYPALCRGTYTIRGSTIRFENECPWTAEFDHTLILSGEYNITVTGDDIEISRAYGGIDKDVYKLTKN